MQINGIQKEIYLIKKKKQKLHLMNKKKLK